jgi:hypothetical protein
MGSARKIILSLRNKSIQQQKLRMKSMGFTNTNFHGLCKKCIFVYTSICGSSVIVSTYLYGDKYTLNYQFSCLIIHGDVKSYGNIE